MRFFGFPCGVGLRWTVLGGCRTITCHVATHEAIHEAIRKYGRILLDPQAKLATESDIWLTFSSFALVDFWSSWSDLSPSRPPSRSLPPPSSRSGTGQGPSSSLSDEPIPALKSATTPPAPARKMCIAAWVWEAHPLYQLLLVFNRDELHDRPTAPVGWWGDGGRKILGGRDGLAGGTWLGCTRNGRIAFLTNFRETFSLPAPKSRGDLPVKFLEGEMSPMEFAEEVGEQGDQYNGFNLVLADLRSKSMVYCTNRGPVAVEIVSPGLHVLSNASLDSPWPKSQLLGKGLKELLDDHGTKDIPTKQIAEQLMRDTTKANRSQLPDTGYGSDVEFEVSSIFVDADLDMGHYRTRSISVVTVGENMSVSFYEECLEGESWKQRQVEYQIEDSEK